MTALDELFQAYKVAYRAGEDPHPRRYVERATPDEQPLLAELIDAFLDQAPVPAGPPPPALEHDPLARRVMAAVEPELRRRETWQTVLPAARHERELTRSTLVARLAQALGVGDRADRVGDYYHRMESGTLDPAGVSDRVLAALERIVGVPAQRLREAGARLASGSTGLGEVFARSASPIESPGADRAPADVARSEPEARDEVDELFLGG